MTSTTEMILYTILFSVVRWHGREIGRWHWICVLLNSFTVWRRKLQANVNVKVQRRNSRNKIDVGRPTLEKVTE